MRYNIQEQVFQKKIESPKLFAAANSSFNEGSDEKAAYHADFTQGYELMPDEVGNAGNDDTGIYKALDENQRYD